jgi:predicted esterase
VTTIPASATSAPIATDPIPPPTETIQPTITPLPFTSGRNEYVIDIDGDPREFIVYLPSGYDPSVPIPVVVMCHGSNQNGNLMYANTGWVAKAEQETFLVVFPTSWKYRLIGETGLHEKWNTPSAAREVVAGTEMKDDVKFMRAIMDSVKTSFNVDQAQIFASGFSNGGMFVLTELIPHMNEVFAAYSTGGASLLNEAASGDLSIRVDTSLYSVVGNSDDKISEGLGISQPFPLTAQAIVADPIFGGMLQRTTTRLDLDLSYSTESDPAFTRLIFNQSLVGADNEYIFMMVRGMGHLYPSGDNNRARVNVADLFWDFFIKHTRQ